MGKPADRRRATWRHAQVHLHVHGRQAHTGEEWPSGASRDDALQGGLTATRFGTSWPGEDRARSSGGMIEYCKKSRTYLGTTYNSRNSGFVLLPALTGFGSWSLLAEL